VLDRHGAAEMPAIRPVRGPKAVFDFEHASVEERLLALCDHHRQVVRVRDAWPGALVHLLFGHARVLEPAVVV